MEKLPEFDGHELVVRLLDKATGLRGFIAIHNTNLGPATGGTRFSYYKTEEDALRDALRLSRAMTYKCALAGVPYGGGKAVLMAPKSPAAAKKLKSDKYFAAYGKRVDMLGGNFSTGEDVGITDHDVDVLAKYSKHINGRSSVGGSLSPWAAASVFISMQAALKFVFGDDSFKGRTVAIKGLGNVGFDLAQMLVKNGAKVIGAETNPERLARARAKIKGIAIVSPEVIHKQEADIFSPCALSGDISQKTIPQLRARIVCGSANNQLATPRDGARLAKRKILYIPDYVANAGGLINVVNELDARGYDRSRVAKDVARIHDTITTILSRSKREHHSPDVVADSIGRDRFERSRNKKLS